MREIYVLKLIFSSCSMLTFRHVQTELLTCS